MRTQGIEADISWYLNEADGDACGLRASAWTHTEEVGALTTVTKSSEDRPHEDSFRRTTSRDSGGRIHVGAQSRSFHTVDVYPEHTDAARARLLRVHRIWCRLPRWAQSVLEARFSSEAGRRASIPGCSPVSRVVELIGPLRDLAHATKTTVREAAIAAFRSDSATQDECVLYAEEAVHRALLAYADVRQELRDDRFRKWEKGLYQ